MNTTEPTREELLDEVHRLRQRIEDLEQADVSRRQTEEALVRQALVLQSILESIGDGVAAADTSGNFFIVNSAAREISGLVAMAGPDEWSGVYGIFHADKTTRYEAEELPILRAIRGEAVDQEEQFLRNPFLPPEGRWLNSTARPLRDSQGNLLGGVVVFRDVTRQKKEEAALRESEERFRSFMDNSPAVAFMKDEAGRFVYYNEPHCQFFHHGPDEWIGKTVFDVYPRAVAEKLHEHDQAVLATDRVQEANEVVPAPDGVPHHWITFKFPVRGAGDRRFVGGVAVNITQRREAEEALRKSEERFRELAQTIPVVFWAADVDSEKVNYVSPAYEAIWGQPCQKVYDNPRGWSDAIHSEDHARVQAAMVRDRLHFREEYRVLRPDGSLRWISDEAFPVYNSEGRLCRLVGIAADITERKRAELALRSSEERFRSLSDCCPVGIFQTNAQAELVYINPRCEAITGWSFEEIVGLNWISTVDPRDRERVVAEGRDAASSGRASDMEMRLVRKDGSSGWFRVRAVPIIAADGTPAGQIGTLEDVTESKRAEAQLQDYAQRLQTLSRRLLDVQEQERRHLARELHDEIGQLLTGLKFSLEMVQRSGEHSRPFLAEAQRLVRDLTARVRDLSLHLRPTMLDDLGLLPALLWLLDRFSAQTQVQVAFEKSGIDRRFPPEVETAAYRIAQEALTNVARHGGVPRATLRVWVDQDLLHVQVEDSGVGFDPAAAQSAARSSGLSGMHERASLLGGRLRVDAEFGRGTTVIAYLPVSGTATVPEIAHSSSPALDGAAAPLNG